MKLRHNKHEAWPVTIEIKKPELEALIHERLQTGEFPTIEDMLLDALRTKEEKQNPASPPEVGRKSLARLFAESPLKGLDLRFDRDADTGRSVEL